MQMRVMAALVGAVWLGLASLAEAQDRPVVVELFTSQGCSSCPPADKILGELAGRDDVIALAFHVDYWDYIGWKDIFASPENTTRQRGYARAAGARSIYTPQMIVGGKDHVIGTRPMKLADLIQTHRDAPQPVTLDLSRSGSELRIRARAVRPVAGRVVVQVAQYKPKQSVAIKRGENAGRTMTYHNIVSVFEVVGEWNGQGNWQGTARIEPGMPVAVIIQRAGLGPVVAAARLR